MRGRHKALGGRGRRRGRDSPAHTARGRARAASWHEAAAHNTVRRDTLAGGLGLGLALALAAAGGTGTGAVVFSGMFFWIHGFTLFTVPSWMVRICHFPPGPQVPLCTLSASVCYRK